MAWSQVRLDELGEVGRGRSRHRPRNDPRLFGGPYPFIQTADIMAANPYITGATQTLSEFGLSQSKIWPADTLCITIAGANTAQTAILKISACFPDSVVAFRVDPSKSDLHFVKYSLDLMKGRFRAVTLGATQDNLSLEKLLSFGIPAPPLAQQQRIGSILGAYDGLIEVNRRRIAVLEEMARRLFEEWFVHFRFPGHEGHTMIETPDGPLPKGWSVGVVGDLMGLAYGRALKAEARISGNIPVIGSSGVVGWHNEALVKGPGIVVGRKGNVGSIIWSPSDFCPIDTVFFVETKKPLLFLLHQLRRLTFQNSDAAVPGLNRNAALSIPLKVPPEDLMREYNRMAEPMTDLVDSLHHANVSLAASRDLLLPRLISGELSVSAAEQELEAVA